MCLTGLLCALHVWNLSKLTPTVSSHRSFFSNLSGIEYVEQIYSAYGEKPNQGKIQNQGNKYLAEEFPLLSYIASARAIGGDKP